MLRISTGQRWFNIVNYAFLIILGLSMILPIVHVLAQSLSSNTAINNGKVFFLPVDFTLSNFKAVVGEKLIWRSFGISVYVTAFGTFINLAMTAMLAYPLSRSEYVYRKPVLILVLLTMIFTAPLIPNFLLVKQLGLTDTLWSLMLPGAISAFNLFVMRSFFMALPVELIDSSRIDGCGEMRILWNIILPLSKPVMATIGIFYAVAHWNSYANALYFINNRQLYPLQVRLREFIITDSSSITAPAEEVLMSSPEGIKMAVVIIATIPIMLVYPFLQKHFTKGMMVGSVKS
ncbi:multiple sugar transport system permease protein/putative aldouronate transport system permease protein [Paenibacillus castaneae]|uniref:carbohydrate ABC transporter permease n=1 Tax=Paenibacillus castaneae TaxID=474957 RepID=UPI000C9B1FF6|nr:carbohydrate ABC transporter permease [Paenibacillus castaneae]NIK78783.1 multiple sugar transport system permease protein/putative aldouronate transport system permease protein [Paenibacillus castaneae]